MTFRLTPLSPETAASLRARADAVHVVAGVSPGFPCRRCLRDAEVGDALVLVGHDPFRGASPYTGSGPLYLHAEDCAPDDRPGEVPDQLRSRLLSVRGYDAAHLLRHADVVDGEDAAAEFARQLADPRVAYLHVHNARPGCFAVRVDRAAHTLP